MATFSSTLNSVYDLVGQSSNAVVSTVSTVSSGAQMLNDFVAHARIKQAKRLSRELITYDDVLLDTAAQEATQREDTLRNFIAGNSEKAKAYSDHKDRLKALFDAADLKSAQQSIAA